MAETQVGDGVPGVSRRGEWLARAGLLLGSLALAALCVEVALRIVAPVAEPGRGDAENDGFEYFDHHPKLGWDLVPGTADRYTTPEFDIAIRISAEGLRSDRVYGPAPAPGVRRAVVLGDSFTFGHGVEVEEGWVALVEAAGMEAGRPLEMVNLAVTGYGVDQMVLRLEERAVDGLAFSPEVVVAAIFLSDVFRVAQESHLGYHKPHFVLDSSRPDGLRLMGVPVPEATSTDAGSGSLLLREIQERGLPLARHLGWGDSWPVTGALLGRLKEQVEAGGAKLVVVLLSGESAALGQGVRHKLTLSAMNRLQGLVDDQGIPSLDITQAFAASGKAHPEEALFYPQDGHWTLTGHAVAADAISAWLAGQWPEVSP